MSSSTGTELPRCSSEGAITALCRGSGKTSGRRRDLSWSCRIQRQKEYAFQVGKWEKQSPGRKSCPLKRSEERDPPPWQPPIFPSGVKKTCCGIQLLRVRGDLSGWGEEINEIKLKIPVETMWLLPAPQWSTSVKSSWPSPSDGTLVVGRSAEGPKQVHPNAQKNDLTPLPLLKLKMSTLSMMSVCLGNTEAGLPSAYTKTNTD